MRSIPIDVIYSSPLSRAKQTAQLIFRDRDIHEDDRLKEMNFGVFEGMKTDDILHQYPDLYHQLWNDPEHFDRIPGGESYEEVQERLASFIKSCYQKHAQESVFMVFHGMTFIVLLGYFRQYLKKDYPKINQHIIRGCSLNLFEIDESGVKEVLINDDHFLKSETLASYRIQK